MTTKQQEYEDSTPLMDDVEDRAVDRSSSKEGKGELALVKGTASLASSIFNISNNILGAGLLTMPYAFHRASTIPALLLLTLMGVICGYSFFLLCRCSEISGLATYKAIGVQAFGKHLGIFCEVIVCLMTLGSCISYNILIGDFIPEVGHYFLEQQSYNTDAGKTVLQGLSNRRLVIGFVAVLVLLPLCSFKKLDSLRFSSTLGVVCILFCSALVVAFCFKNEEPAAVRESAKIANLNTGIFVTCALMSVAFTMHYNALQFWMELRQRTTKTAMKAIGASFSLCWVLYASVGLAGYYTFGETVEGDVLKSYQNPSYGLWIECSRLSLATCVSVTYPLPFFACRAALYKVFWGGTDYSNNIRFYTVTVCLIGATVLVAMFASDVSVVLSYKGAVLGTPIVMIFPALFYMRLTPGPMFVVHKWRPITVLVFGIISSIMGTIVTTLDIAIG